MDVIQQLWMQLHNNPMAHLGPASYIVLAILEMDRVISAAA